MPEIADDRCRFTFTRLAQGVLEIVIDGIDNGQFGTQPLDQVAVALLRECPLEIFIDATRVDAAVSVSREWARFFALNQKDLKCVGVLAAPARSS